MTKAELYNDNFQNHRVYNIPKAQLVIADIPYNIGRNFYGSNPMWYQDGDNANGESDKAGKAPCMIVFCSFQQQNMVIETGAKYGFEISRDFCRQAYELMLGPAKENKDLFVLEQERQEAEQRRLWLD